MGAARWEVIAAYCEDPEQALQQAQTRCFQEVGYNLSEILARRIEDMTGAVRSCEEDDPYDLLEHYRDALDQFRAMASTTLPEHPREQVEWLRRIEEISSDEIGNILDMTGISVDSEDWQIQRLTPDRLQEVFGTDQPTLPDARRAVRERDDLLSRGTAIGFPVFEAGRPIAWFFAGETTD